MGSQTPAAQLRVDSDFAKDCHGDVAVDDEALAIFARRATVDDDPDRLVDDAYDSDIESEDEDFFVGREIQACSSTAQLGAKQSGVRNATDLDNVASTGLSRATTSRVSIPVVG